VCGRSTVGGCVCDRRSYSGWVCVTGGHIVSGCMCLIGLDHSLYDLSHTNPPTVEGCLQLRVVKMKRSTSVADAI